MKVIGWIFAVVIIVAILIYAAGAAQLTGATSSAFNTGVKALYGPGKYASGTP